MISAYAKTFLACVIIELVFVLMPPVDGKTFASEVCARDPPTGDVEATKPAGTTVRGLRFECKVYKFPDGSTTRTDESGNKYTVYDITKCFTDGKSYLEPNGSKNKGKIERDGKSYCMTCKDSNAPTLELMTGSSC